MDFTYSKLRGRIIEKYGSMIRFAEALNISNVSVSRKMNGSVSFTKDDIVEWSELLGIQIDEIGAYFFT